MTALLKWTGLGKLVYFYRHIYLNQPRLTTLTGIVLILGVGAVHAVEAPRHFEAATYLGVLFVLEVVATLVAAAGIFGGAKVWGWTFGAAISILPALAYLFSRLFSLPGLGEAAGGWDEPLGSLALILEGLFLAAWFSVVTGAAVASPDKRGWHD